MSTTLEIPCLGKPFSPGQLYDARNDKLLTLSLWNCDKLEKGIKSTQTHYSNVSISAGKSLKEKLKLLDVSGHVKLSFLGGLIEAEGSASYLNKQDEKRDEVSVLLVYRADVESRQLDMKLFDKEVGIDHPSFMDDDSATHVVTQTTYGANASFEFKKGVTDLTSKNEIKGNLSLAIQKIPQMGGLVSGGGSLEMDKELKEVTENLTVSFQGDFIINSPTTFTEAIAVYKDLPGKTQKEFWSTKCYQINREVIVLYIESPDNTEM